MKSRYILGCLLATSAAISHAQSNVTIYGVVDTGVEYVNNIGAADANLTRIPSLTATLPSRIGFRGTEDLGAGLKAIFTLENGFDPGVGSMNQGGRLFGRQAWVGVQSNWGTFTVGRNYTMLFWANNDADVLGPNIYGTASLDPYIPNARSDNSLAYRGTFGGVTVGATYSLGRDAAGAAGVACGGESATDAQACRGWSALVKYDAPVWGVAVAHDRLRGATGVAALGGSGLEDKRTVINGYVKFAGAKVGGGLIRRDNEGALDARINPTRKSNLFFLGASYPVTPAFTLDGQVFKLDYKGSSAESTMFALRGTYALSKRTAAYVTAGRIDNDGGLINSVSGGGVNSTGNLAASTFTAASASQTGVMVGVRHAF
ncbi:MAG: porin [Noviherbaspirillum sp.]|nr:porin [Noviherbaspirillum sp.]MDB5795091.1 porin [Noviherbaspirillum sp.]